MAVQLGSRGQADFTQPIELLMDCHRRIESFLEVLERVVERCGAGELHEEGRRALLAALEYFRHAAPKHTADEEESLLPRLRELDRADLAPVLAEAERIEREHLEASELHDRVELIGRGWLERGALAPDALAALRADLSALRRLYAGHIAFEDERLFPAAAAALGAGALTAIGKEMAQRRGTGAAGGASPEPGRAGPQ